MNLHDCNNEDGCKNGDTSEEGSGTTIDTGNSENVRQNKTIKEIDYGKYLFYMY